MEQNRPIDRLLAYLSYKGIKPFKAENELVLSNGYLYNSSKKQGNIGSDILDKIFKAYLDLNLIWLVTGTGEMLNNIENNAETHTVAHHFNESAIGYITDTPGAKAAGNTYDTEKGVQPTVQPATILNPQYITVDREGAENILYVNVKAAAGYLNGYADREWVEKQPSFSLPGLNDASYRAFQVDGDSMHPTLEDKEMVIGKWVEKLDYIREDRVHIIVTKNRGIIVKRVLNRIEQYGYLVAKSDAFDNRSLYENIEVYPDEIVEIWYAVWHGSFNFKSPSDMYKKVNNLEADLTEVMRVLKANKLLK